MVPERGIRQGTLFGYGPGAEYSDLWETESGSFSLNTEAGDNVFLYCVDADSKIRFLAGFSNHGSWSDPGLSAEEYGEAMTALPDDLKSAAILLPHKDNYFYNGTRDETITLLRADMLAPSSWQGDDEDRFGFDGGRFVDSGAMSLTTVAVFVLSGLVVLMN